ncbi:DUF72 domain-containing protein [Deferrisoma camini]|uniref:DUF72 domain-containing protein n=1 Tax=Deferrisoma camini TaxID=1035120 RepID=UPI001FE05CF9|nr:DUF72 domain-containing protein [Deferrisoma camini]
MARARYWERFRAVEVQQTFYRPPRIATLERWRAEAPAEAVFALKAWQVVTHPATSPTYRRLARPVAPDRRDRYGFFQPTEEVAGGWNVTREAALALGAVAVLFQCPASFRPTPENVENLRRFFRGIGPQPFLLAWEPRGPWPRELVGELCQDLGLVHAVDPFGADPTTPDPVYLRLHGRGGYRYRYSDGELRELATRLRGRTGFVFFNNDHMWEDARRFLQASAGVAGGGGRG